MTSDPYRLRVETVAREAAVAVMNGDAATLPDALDDVDAPAVRADAEFFAELLLQEMVEKRAELGRAAS
uniref:hypothetical protein n=1 Tax=Halorubrum sp. T3 TaxID=1194088 RepID=UPI00042EF391|nr:hypothetical protein [Halorubrum sp. T3]AGI12345.1 hypothetical protein [Halorubrum sp. T3]